MEPLLQLTQEQGQLLHDRSRKKPAEQKLKAIEVLQGKQAVIEEAYSKIAMDPVAVTTLRTRVLDRAFELAKDDLGCLMVSHLLSEESQRVRASWQELRASAEDNRPVEYIFPGDIAYTASLHEEGVAMQIVGLEVPASLVGKNIVELKLRQEYQMLAVALETNKGLDLQVQTLIAGSRLWVGFEFGMEMRKPQECVEKFLGACPETVPVRLLPLVSFLADERPTWIGQDLMSSRMRADYGINVIGIYPAMTSSINDIVWFPGAKHVLSTGDKLLLLSRDLAKLKGEASSAPDSSAFVEQLVGVICAAEGGGSFGMQPGCNRVIELSKDKSGCHVIQEAMAHAPATSKAKLAERLLEAPDALLQDVIKSQHGIHVVKSCLTQAYKNQLAPQKLCATVGEQFLKIIEGEADMLEAQLQQGQKVWRELPTKFLGAPGALLDKKKFSYRLVLWVIEFFRAKPRLQDLLGCLAANAAQLIDDNNGSIVLSSVLEHGSKEQRELIFKVILSRMDDHPIPKHWYPSFLIDKLIIDKHILDEIDDGKARLMEAFLRGDNLCHIQAHRSGAYTAKRVYQDLVNKEERRELERVCPNLAEPEVMMEKKKSEKKTDFNFNDSLLA